MHNGRPTRKTSSAQTGSADLPTPSKWRIHLPVSLLLTVFVLGFASQGIADGPADNQAGEVRPIPPVGIEVDPETIQQLSTRCQAIRTRFIGVQMHSKEVGDSAASLASEVLVFPRAVELAIEFGQFYKPKELEHAEQLLDEADRRIDVIAKGGDWADVVGLGDGGSQQLIVGGYESKIDGSFQPYGLVIPVGLTKNSPRPRRLDLWFHGRGETQSEVAFLTKQSNNAGEYTPVDTVVLHPYGRYCNAFKFAGEVDVLESLQYVQSRLPVDPNRISVRGFSMGGAACWQMATHHPGLWFAANPGAGFSETPEFLNFFQGEDVRKTAPDYQQKLWPLYDSPPWAANLKHCPTVAYSGEVDRQKQAADVMEVALRDVGIDMLHVIGPDTAHKIHPDSKIEIERRMSALARTAPSNVPSRIDFTTLTLRYHRLDWVDVQGMIEHWQPATVKANIDASSRIRVTTKNVSRLRFQFDSGQWPGAASGSVKIEIDGSTVISPPVRSDRSWDVSMVRRDKTWTTAKPDDDTDELRKRPGLQGPIDDGLMDSFLFVLPSEKSEDPIVQQWVEAESKHAMQHWRKHFRGDVRQTLDRDLTDEQIASSSLVIFGDLQSNEVLARIADRIPVTWNQDSISIGEQKVAKAGHVPIMIFPNPLNPERYVVINSGFTFREYDYLNNARQTPKLPDWALVDVRDGATTQSPGVVKSAGFFNERWQPK
ncbi:Prolyl oligopeptidase family protein [Rubripirellula lacrimiformis]|uniref:Prolyl oligopeptidase family protein n=1 Tax=Rubripirellula lacrimiformis TaxID=1930273 RepID=A0A517N3F9_9BACT|nr:prolyl oligopeptidase family serine peptidase [Rubripirellula lacrimiformis]QDT01676.1 Prolyl oligopeptidase family protein [Rubripirellula lacrimiformis]